MEQEKINWVSVIPKIGGSSIGSFQAASSLPLYQVSYSEFQRNDAHIARYWPTVPMFYLDKFDNCNQFIESEIDFVIVVCPCSGLSMLNTVTSGKTGRGGTSTKNEWMIRTSCGICGSFFLSSRQLFYRVSQCKMTNLKSLLRWVQVTSEKIHGGLIDMVLNTQYMTNSTLV